MTQWQEIKRLYGKSPAGFNLLAIGFTGLGILIALIFQVGCVTC